MIFHYAMQIDSSVPRTRFVLLFSLSAPGNNATVKVSIFRRGLLSMKWRKNGSSTNSWHETRLQQDRHEKKVK